MLSVLNLSTKYICIYDDDDYCAISFTADDADIDFADHAVGNH